MPLKRKKKNKNFLFVKAITISLVILFFVALFSYLQKINSSSGRNQNIAFVVKEGSGISAIADDLFEEELIGSKRVFKIYIRLSKKDLIIREGSYDLNRNMSIKDIVGEFDKKIPLRADKKVSFIEGWNLRDYARVLKEEFLVDEEDFFQKLGQPMLNYHLSSGNSWPQDFSGEFDFLKDKPKNYGLEGYLFPDTYRFYDDSSLEDIVIKILKNFDQKLTTQMRSDISAQGKTIFEIITMASIIQKEVTSEKDMKIVSGIFWNRIKNGQPLQSCATLAYILGINKAIYTIEDTKTPSLYNTYLHQGLPPGPISNPGLRAIEAAIYPTENNYNYFLSRPDTKETIFNVTYEGHLADKNKYLK